MNKAKTNFIQCQMPKSTVEFLKSERAKNTPPYHKYYDEALAALEGTWISVEECLPDKYVLVLAHMPGQAPLSTVHECYIGEDGNWCSAIVYGVEHEKITHWMPMPKFSEVQPEENKSEREE